MKMVVCDLSAIEHRVLGWMTRCPGILEVHRQHRDPYLDFAVKLYAEKNLKYDELVRLLEAKDPATKEFRQNSKPPVLGCGYALGGGNLITNAFGDTVRSGLWGYALNVCGVDMPQELAHKAVKIFRAEYPEVPQFWLDMENAFKWVLKHGGTITIGQQTWNSYDKEWATVAENSENAYITFSRVQSKALGKIIRMRLPSGRYLHYLNARTEMENIKNEEGDSWQREIIYYDGIEHSATTDASGAVAKKAHKWGKTKTYGGKLTENADQAISRDLLAYGMQLAQGLGFKIFGLFHDEMATEVDDRRWDAPCLADLKWAMVQAPDWAPTMVLGAEGWEGFYYHKE
jgi:DNA polymerase bacteriophage-type